MMTDIDKKKLFDEAFKQPGIQAPDIAYYTLLFVPLLTGVIGFAFWGYATLFRPNLKEERLRPLLVISCVLMGAPIGLDVTRRQN